MTYNLAYWICAQTGVTPMAIGMPGVGKTQSLYAFARATGRKIYTLIASIRDPADIGGYPYPGEVPLGNNGDKQMVMKILPPKWASDCYDGGKWIVFLDEATTCMPACQAALLRVVAERYVGDTALPEETWLLGACNPPEQAANGIEFEAAMANRMCHLPWQTPTDVILDGFAAGLEFEAPTVPVLPDNWRNKIPGVGGLVRAFHRKNPGRLTMFPEDRAQQSGPWPSPRSWANAITCMAAAQSVEAEKGVEIALLEGLVGKGVAVEFSKWRDHLDLPDPEELLAKAHDALEAGDDMEYEHPDRADKVMAMIAAVSQRVHDDLTVPRWEAGMHVLEQAALRELDVALSVAKPLATVMPKGAKMSATFVQRIFPRMKRALRLPM